MMPEETIESVTFEQKQDNVKHRTRHMFMDQPYNLTTRFAEQKSIMH